MTVTVWPGVRLKIGVSSRVTDLTPPANNTLISAAFAMTGVTSAAQISAVSAKRIFFRAPLPQIGKSWPFQRTILIPSGRLPTQLLGHLRREISQHAVG